MLSFGRTDKKKKILICNEPPDNSLCYLQQRLSGKHRMDASICCADVCPCVRREGPCYLSAHESLFWVTHLTHACVLTRDGNVIGITALCTFPYESNWLALFAYMQCNSNYYISEAVITLKWNLFLLVLLTNFLLPSPLKYCIRIYWLHLFQLTHWLF